MARRNPGLEMLGQIVLVVVGGVALLIFMAGVWLVDTVGPQGAAAVAVLLMGGVSCFAIKKGLPLYRDLKRGPVYEPPNVPHDEFGPVFSDPQQSKGFYLSIMRDFPILSCRLRAQEVIRQYLYHALNSKDANLASSSMIAAENGLADLRGRYEIEALEWEPMARRLGAARKEYSTVRYINAAKGHLQRGAKLKTERGRGKHVAKALEVIEEGLSDPQADGARLAAFLDTLRDM
jgi:hypothetical protein